MSSIPTPPRPTIVTGGCGFVGSHLCRHLRDRGDEVTVLDDNSVGFLRPSLSPVGSDGDGEAVDLRDQDRVSRCLEACRPQSVFHLAAVHYIPACDADPARTVSVNAHGTQSLLDACASISSIESVVVASTAAVYAPSDQAHTEESAIGPTDIYGLTKLWTEQMAGLFSKRTGTQTAVARLFNVYGPGETNPHLIPEILRQLEQGETLRLGNLTTRRDYVHVDDICRGLVMLDEARREGDVLVCNLGNENAIDGHSLLKAMESALDLSIDVELDEARLRRSPDRPLLLSDCSRAHRDLGWYPEIDFTEGLLSAARQPFIAGSA